MHCLQLTLQHIVLLFRRAARNTLAYAWEAWLVDIRRRKHVKQALMGAVMRLCHKATSQAFGQWREYVEANKALGEQQHSAMQHMETLRLQQCWDSWRHTKALKQRHQASVCNCL